MELAWNYVNFGIVHSQQRLQSHPNHSSNNIILHPTWMLIDLKGSSPLINVPLTTSLWWSNMKRFIYKRSYSSWKQQLLTTFMWKLERHSIWLFGKYSFFTQCNGIWNVNDNNPWDDSLSVKNRIQKSNKTKRLQLSEVLMDFTGRFFQVWRSSQQPWWKFICSANSYILSVSNKFLKFVRNHYVAYISVICWPQLFDGKIIWFYINVRYMQINDVCNWMLNVYGVAILFVSCAFFGHQCCVFSRSVSFLLLCETAFIFIFRFCRFIWMVEFFVRLHRLGSGFAMSDVFFPTTITTVLFVYM